MIWTKKIKAGALQFVLFIGTIIAVLLMSFMLISQTHTLFKKKTDITVALIQATDRGLAYSFGQNMKKGESLKVPDHENLGIDIHVEKQYWGILERRTVLAKKGQLQFIKTGFVGHSSEEIAALYLKDDQRPMVIVGDAKITGTAYLPQRGIKMGNIGGYGYNKPQLVYGKKQQSTPILPELEAGQKKQLTEMTTLFFEPSGVDVDLRKGMVLKNSFKEEVQIVKGFVIDLENVKLSGNIMVWATDRIIVHASSLLKDVLLMAPKIEVRDGVSGNFQAIARDWIKVGKNAQLDYPTVLAVQNSKVNGQKEPTLNMVPNISLETGAVVSGAIIYMDDDNEPSRRVPNIRIEKNSMVVGEVYCSQAMELRGIVHGSVTTNAFFVFENGNAYLNHLYNGKINADMLPVEYGGLCFENKSANQTVKWLY